MTGAIFKLDRLNLNHFDMINCSDAKQILKLNSRSIDRLKERAASLMLVRGSDLAVSKTIGL